jgi:putative DNA primase/helicase
MRHPPEALAVVASNIPEELRALDQWAAWRWELRGGKWTKAPLRPATGRYARNNDPDTWGSFEAALARMHEDRLPGVGFMFHSEDGFAGVDLDGCRAPMTGETKPWALEIVRGLDAYTEVSPTGTGLKVFLRGELPSGRRRKGQVEMYDRGRFFTTTGRRLADAPTTISGGQEELSRLHLRVFGPEKPPRTKRTGYEAGAATGLADSELVERAMHAANGEKFSRLWAGDTREYATPANEGRSEADLALCSLLAFWCGPDEERIDRLFRQSGLMRQKWERDDYRALTLAAALDREEFWGGGAALTFGRTYARREGVVSVG